MAFANKSAVGTIQLARTHASKPVMAKQNVVLVSGLARFIAAILGAANSVMNLVHHALSKSACGSEHMLSTVVDFLEMKEYKEVDVDEAPCIFPDCGHFFTVESMDGQMSMRDHYELDENDIPTGIKTAADPFSMDEVKTCSVCRSSLRNIARYGRIVRRAMLDEATKKFISWSAIRHIELADRLMTEQQRLEQSEEKEQDVGRSGRLSLTGDAVTQIKNLRKWVGQKRYNGLVQVYTDISRFVDQVSVQAQPFHKVFEFVRHAKRQNRTGGSFDYDRDIIQL
ncbi:hypothetical protein Daus18300_001364 [Diaporthe australafricana]|uniref:Uncharacterized protein n=1 Tax=Diaporthe australafricana TaxID=127596 RepID=A0ABR3XXL6_9PEZI